MHRFEVWAPSAAKMAVEVDGARNAMQGPDEQGWWHTNVAKAGPGSDYGFVVDDDDRAYPDPRSLWQPNGVHGLSRVYDHNAFAWTAQKFEAAPLSSALVYELHTGTFSPKGTLDGAIEKLSYLGDLGVTHIELMPVAAFAG